MSKHQTAATTIGKEDLIVITGAGGFIAGALTRYFHDQGFTNIRAVDKKPLYDWYQRIPGVQSLCLDVSYRENAARPGALTSMINYYRATFLGGGGWQQRKLGFPRIDVPTLMVWGEQDVALGKETTYGTDRYVSDLTLRYLSHVSHWVQQEAPETVNTMLKAWLSGQVVPEA